MKRAIVLAGCAALLAGCGGSRSAPPPAPVPTQAQTSYGTPIQAPAAYAQPAVTGGAAPAGYPAPAMVPYVAPVPVAAQPQGLTAGPPGAPVRVVSAVQLTPNCQYLSAITESRYSGYLFAGNGLRKARNKVLASAQDMGATHLVWDASNSGGIIQSASGSAYRCFG